MVLGKTNNIGNLFVEGKVFWETSVVMHHTFGKQVEAEGLQFY